MRLERPNFLADREKVWRVVMRLVTLSLVGFSTLFLRTAASAEVIHACIKKGSIEIVADPLDCDLVKGSAISWEVEPTAPAPPRFEDCGDGTVADHHTGLQWEKKSGTVGTPILCDTTGCPDPHDVNNLYDWSNTGTDPDGGAFFDFLARLNGEFDPFADPGCFADHCDWELPKISELQTILIGFSAAPGQAPICSAVPCIDPDFAAVGGPTQSLFYWSASDLTIDRPSFTAWEADFGANNRSDIGGTVDQLRSKSGDIFVRAVRAGSCN